MNNSISTMMRNMTVVVAAIVLTACATAPSKPQGAIEARNKLTQLQSDPQLATRAPVAIKDAEQAVKEAEKPQKDLELGKHLVYLADRKVEIASARAESRLLEDQRKQLSEQREGARLDSRTQEADRARQDAQSAQRDAQAAQLDAQTAQQGALDAQQQNKELQRQITELNAKPTERGMVITLGDLLFATGKSDLNQSAGSHLDKLATFLNQHKDQSIVIEGHTDSVGSEALNLSLSQDRADSVKTYLVAQGVESRRVQTRGKGKSSPVADNKSAAGRQRNRRVEIIMDDMNKSSQ
jgi:outer membrane protein OmpA-like peptidoglycan-associated protein